MEKPVRFRVSGCLKYKALFKGQPYIALSLFEYDPFPSFLKRGEARSKSLLNSPFDKGGIFYYTPFKRSRPSELGGGMGGFLS
jgi:hypothetical protein